MILSVSECNKHICIEYYKNSANDLPKRHFYNKFAKDYKQWALNYFDFVHFTIPLNFGTADGFQFPSEYVGQYGVYDAVKHLYNQSKDLKPLLKEESLYVNRKYFSSDMEKSIESVRASFREKHKIPENGAVIFFAPGNEEKEAIFCTDTVRKGIKEFMLKYSSPTSLSPKAPPMDHYTTILSLHKGSEAE